MIMLFFHQQMEQVFPAALAYVGRPQDELDDGREQGGITYGCVDQLLRE
jgi:hypothetical protein